MFNDLYSSVVPKHSIISTWQPVSSNASLLNASSIILYFIALQCWQFSFPCFTNSIQCQTVILFLVPECQFLLVNKLPQKPQYSLLLKGYFLLKLPFLLPEPRTHPRFSFICKPNFTCEEIFSLSCCAIALNLVLSKLTSLSQV